MDVKTIILGCWNLITIIIIIIKRIYDVSREVSINFQ